MFSLIVCVRVRQFLRIVCRLPLPAGQRSRPILSLAQQTQLADALAVIHAEKPSRGLSSELDSLDRTPQVCLGCQGVMPEGGGLERENLLLEKLWTKFLSSISHNFKDSSRIFPGNLEKKMHFL